MKIKQGKIVTCIMLLVTATSCTVSNHSEQSGRLPSDGDAGYLNLERIFTSKEFEVKKFGPVHWLEDGFGYTTLEDSESPAESNEPASCSESQNEKPKDIVRYNPETGSREILVPSTRLKPKGESKPLKIEDYSWSEDRKKVLIFTNTKRVWRENTKGDYWVLDLTNWELQKLGDMGLPDDNEEGYKNGSPITFAHQLRGNLLIVHGTGDDNCHYQSCEALINELIKHNKHFTMMAYPNRTHSIKEPEFTERHLYELLTRYLNENLSPG